MKGDEPGGPIRWRMRIPAPPERVFEALDSAEGRESFWAEKAPEHGGVIAFRFVDGTACEARILERRAPALFSIRYFGTEVRFELAPDGKGGTDLLLTNTGVRGAEWNEVHAGWLNVLFPLKAWLAAAVDLRNHDPDRTWNHGYADS